MQHQRPSTTQSPSASPFRTGMGFLAVLLVLEGAALMTVELLGARLLSSFYGSSLYVWTAVLSLTVLGLSVGYFFGGKFSQRHASLRNLSIILGLAGIWVIGMPFIAKGVIALTAKMDLVPGVSLATLLLIVPAMISFGLVGPMAVRWMTRDMETSGKSSGQVYFLSTAGGILSTFVFGYYAIHFWGLKASALACGVSLLLIPVWYFIFLVKKESNVEIPTATSDSKKSTKSKAAQPTPVSFYLFSALEGASVMAVELLAARMLAPYFGGSLTVWATVLGLTLLSLAVGYFVGGKWGDSSKKSSSIQWAVLWAGVFILGMHLIASRLTWVFSEWELNIALIAVALLLLFPPLVFLGTVPTLLIRAISRNTEETGTVAGRVFALSAASGILILPVLGFWVIPAFGLTLPSILLGALVGGTALIGLLAQKQYLALVLLPVLLFSVSKREVFGQSREVKVLEYSEGLLGQVLVADVLVNGKGKAINDRTLFVNRMGQTVMNNQTGNSQYLYITFASAAASVLPEGSKALLLGLGGGSMANALDKLNFEVDAVELDQRIARVAKEHFRLSKQVNVIVDDARHYLATSDKKYDLILFDVFKGDVFPPQVLSLEAFQQAKSLLNPGGVAIINLNGFISGDIGRPGRNVFQTLQTAGFQVELLPTPGEETNRNNLFIATAESKDFSVLRSPLLFRGESVGLSTLFEKVALQPGDRMYTDNRSTLERDNLLGGSTWRQDYVSSYIPFLEKNLIPLFR